MRCLHVFPSQWLLSRRAAVVRQSDSVGELKSGAETHLFSTASQSVPDSVFFRSFFLSRCLLPAVCHRLTLASVFSAALPSGHIQGLKNSPPQFISHPIHTKWNTINGWIYLKEGNLNKESLFVLYFMVWFNILFQGFRSMWGNFKYPSSRHTHL